MSEEPEPELVRAEGMVKQFPLRGGVFQTVRGHVHAVDGVDVRIRRGETLGIVGESGCGKTTLARLLLRLIEPSGGRVYFMGHDLTGYNRAELQQARQDLQIVFQDPFSALNPRMTIKNIVGEPLLVHGLARGEELTRKVLEVLEVVGLKKEHLNRFPHEFSGGQRQRINVARALILRPDFIVLDEPTSALDVSVQAQVLNLLMDLQEQFGLTYLFITHNLSVVYHISNRVAVMYAGKIVEFGETEALFTQPLHPYTEALLSAIPQPDPRRLRQRIPLGGEVPSPIAPPPGCRFHPRCWMAQPECAKVVPPLRTVRESRQVACHLVDDAGVRGTTVVRSSVEPEAA